MNIDIFAFGMNIHQKRKYYYSSKIAVLLVLGFLFFKPFHAFSAKDGHIDSLLLIKNYSINNLSAQDYFDITLFEFHRDSLFRAMEYARKGISIAKTENNYKILGNLYNIKGYIHLNFGTYIKSIDFFSQGEQIGKEHNLPKLIISADHGMGRVYNELGEYDKALEVLNRGLKLALSDSSTRNASVFYNAIGVSLQHKNDFKGSLASFNKFLKMSLEKNDSLNILYAYVNIGETYRLDSNYDVAVKYYYKAQSLNKFINDQQAEAAIYGNLSSIYSAKGEYKKAISYLRKGINVCSNNNGLSSYLLIEYKTIIDDYVELSSFDSAYFFYKKYTSLHDSVYERDRIRTINSLRVEYQIEESEAQAKILAQKLRNRTIILISSILLSALIILLLILVYSRYKLKTKVLKEEAKALNLTIDEKNRELVTRVMAQNQQEEMYESISKALLALEKDNDPTELHRHLKTIKDNISSKKKTGMGWESFKMHFENVHPDFFEKLLKKSDSLTQNDLRLCGYIKLNLSTKDIANILNVSDRTIQTSRYRIKKKLNLPSETNLVQFIQSL